VSKRKSISDSLLRNLSAFYKGRRCIISENGANTDWHHLDENSSNTTFVNLIPISRDYNNLLERYRRIEAKADNWKGYDPIFFPEGLNNKSKHHFMRGDVALAYGCARLASWMCRRYPSLFQKEKSHIQYSLDAMNCARHSAMQNLMIDIIERDFIPYLQVSVSSIEKIKILEEMAAIYQEYGLINEARELFDLINSNKNLISKEEQYLQEARFLRRLAIINIQEKRDIIDAVDKLNAADKYADSNKRVAIQNALAWTKMSTNNATNAIDFLNPIVDKVFTRDGLPDTLFVAPWNAIETLLTYYGALLMKEKRNAKAIKNVEEQLIYILQTYKNKDMQLRPIAYSLSSQFRGHSISKIEQLYTEILKPSNDIMSFALNSILIKVVKLIRL